MEHAQELVADHPVLSALAALLTLTLLPLIGTVAGITVALLSGGAL